jgi:long-chain acyl-CoA synthetase
MSMTENSRTPGAEIRISADVNRNWLAHYDPWVPQSIPYPSIPIFQLLEDTASKHPQAPCTRFFGRRIAFVEMQELATRFAAAARRLGVRQGDRVVLLLPNSPQFLIAYYGSLMAGAVVVPLNPLCSERELIFHLNDSGAQLAVTVPLFLPKLAALIGKTPLRTAICAPLCDFLPFPLNLLQGLQEWHCLRGLRPSGVVQLSALLREKAPPDFRPAQPDVHDLAVLIYSGGTTGVAKGIMLSHFNVVANAHQVAMWAGIGEKERLLAVLPLFHGFGMSVTMNAPVLRASEIVLLPRFSARSVVQAIEKTRPSFLIGVPTMFVALSNLPRIEKHDLSSLQGIFVGAAPLTRAIKDDFETKTGGRMIEGYGLTEAVTAIMANPYKGTHKVGSIGVPFPDVDAKIVSLEDGSDLPPGELGEIVVRGPVVMKGYYKQPEATRQTLVDGWLLTGDIGYVDDDGYFYITDRKKDLIIVGGFNVFPREVDELLYQHPKVKEGITIGLPDAYKGERIKVFIVLKEGEMASEQEMIDYFKQRLTPYKVPSEVEFRQDLPKSIIGKILRRELRMSEVQGEPGARAEGL